MAKTVDYKDGAPVSCQQSRADHRLGHLLRFNYLFILLMLQPGSSQAPAGSERPTDQIDNQSDIISQRGRKTANKSWQAGLPTPPPGQE